MPRGRMLNKSISKSEKVAKLSLEATLLFTWIVPHTDVEGRVEADVWTIKAIVPYIKEITPENIPDLLTEMHEVGLINYYGDEHKYLQVIDFCKYQKVRTDQEAPSHIPTPAQQRGKNGVETEKKPLKLSKVNISKVNVRGRFTPPLPTEVSSYCEERNNGIDGKYFVDYYCARGWKTKGGSPVVDWKACVRTWEGQNKPKQGGMDDVIKRLNSEKAT